MKKQNAQTLLHVKRNKSTKRDKTDVYLWGEETSALKEAAETRVQRVRTFVNNNPFV